MQNKVLQIICKAKYNEHCRSLFKKSNVFPLPCLYVYQYEAHIKRNLPDYIFTSDTYCYNIRKEGNLNVPILRLEKSKISPNFSGKAIFNKLPSAIKKLPMNKFKVVLKYLLLDNCYYSVNKFLKQNVN